MNRFGEGSGGGRDGKGDWESEWEDGPPALVPVGDGGLTVAVLGVGDLRFGPPALAALAGYFGERPLEVVLQHDDAEILDAMHRLARAFFKVGNARHAIVSTTDLDEAIGIASCFVVCGEGLSAARDERVAALPLPDGEGGAWPPPLDAAGRAAMPLQILRWIRLEDWPWEPLLQNRAAPLRAFLDARMARV